MAFLSATIKGFKVGISVLCIFSLDVLFIILNFTDNCHSPFVLPNKIVKNR